MKKCLIFNNRESLYDFTGNPDKALGYGSCGEVYNTKNGYAIKSCYKLTLDIIKEIFILKHLNHPNIISLIGVQLPFKIDNKKIKKVKIIMELSSGTLNLDNINTIEKRKWIFYQLFRGLLYCNTKFIIHKDIKPENILIFPGKNSDQPIIKISDFNLSEYYPRFNGNLNITTIFWRAPEILLKDSNYTEKIDIWALGVMLLDGLCSEYQLTGDDPEDQFNQIIELLGHPKNIWPEYKNLNPEWFIPNCKNTLEHILKKYLLNNKTDSDEIELIINTLQWPNKRWSAKKALDSKYFDSIRNIIESEIPFKNEKNYDIEHLKTYPPDRNNTLNIFLYYKKTFKEFNYRSIIYSLILYDICNGFGSELKYLAYMKISCSITIEKQIYGIKEFAITNKIYKENKNDFGIYFSDEISNILNIINFNLYFPTCADFIYEYLKNSNNLHFLTKCEITALQIYNNELFAIKYNQCDIAKLSIIYNNIKIDNIENIELNDDVLYYLKNTVLNIPTFISEK